MIWNAPRSKTTLALGEGGDERGAGRGELRERPALGIGEGEHVAEVAKQAGDVLNEPFPGDLEAPEDPAEGGGRVDHVVGA